MLIRCCLVSFFIDIPKIRLTGPPYREGAGHVEVYINRHWGRVCDSAWGYYEAKVVCRQLGYSDAERSTCCGWYFGAGSGPTLMAYATCKGNETTLFHCPHVGATKRLGCGIRDTAGVICKLRKPNGRHIYGLKQVKKGQIFTVKTQQSCNPL